MRKQEEIRDIVAKYLAFGGIPFERIAIEGVGIDKIDKPQEGYFVEADELLLLLHKQGVVVATIVEDAVIDGSGIIEPLLEVKDE